MSVAFSSRFARSQSGAAAIVFALSVTVVCLALGVAVDMSRVMAARRIIQDSADAAVLRAVTLPSYTAFSVRSTAADKAFNEDLAAPQATIVTNKLANLSTDSTVNLKYTVTAEVAGFFAPMIGKDHYDLIVTAESLSRLQKSEIALVLDSTGSMTLDNRMVNLKSSVDSVLASMQDSSGKNISGTQVAIVPFNTQVRVGAATNLDYVDYGTESVAESCSGLNGTICSIAWDVLDKICTGASNMTTCRTNSRAWSTTSTAANGDIYYTVVFHAYETVSGGYKNYSYTETYFTSTKTTYTAPYYTTDETGTHYNAGGNSTSTSTTYYSQAAATPTVTANLNSYNTAPASGTAIATGALTWTVSNGNGFGALAATTTTTKSNGVNRTYMYPAAADTKSKWLGCIIDRTQPYDTQADAPTTAVVATLYPARACSTTNLKVVQGLSTDIKAARAFVQTLTPGGNTNITIGVQWGMEVLSPTAPFTGGVKFKDEVTRKYMIVVTDGTNTANRWTSTAATIDARTALACENAKKLGITIFVVKVIEGNSDMLKKCASDQSYFYDLTSASQINTALSSAFEAIKKTRLTK